MENEGGKLRKVFLNIQVYKIQHRKYYSNLHYTTVYLYFLKLNKEKHRFFLAKKSYAPTLNVIDNYDNKL